LTSVGTLVLARLFARYLDLEMETAKRHFPSSSQAAACSTNLTLKDRGNSVKYLAQGHNKQTCRLIFTLTLLMLIVKEGYKLL